MCIFRHTQQRFIGRWPNARNKSIVWNPVCPLAKYFFSINFEEERASYGIFLLYKSDRPNSERNYNRMNFGILFHEGEICIVHRLVTVAIWPPKFWTRYA